MTAPQIIMAILIALSLIGLLRETDLKEATGNGIALLVLLSLLLWGGFWK